MMRFRDLTGQRFHSLLVLYKAKTNRADKTDWVCLCDCGKEVVCSIDHLTRKKSPIKSCGCKRVRLGADHSQWGGYGEISGNWWYNHVLRERKQSSRCKVPVTVSIEYAWNLFLAQNQGCALSRVELLIGEGPYGTASIDRIDSSKGYEEGNIQWVHKDVNFMKRTYTMEYFIEMCSKIVQHSLNKDN